MDNILYGEDKKQMDAWIDKYMDTKFWTISVFEAIKKSCKRSWQNVKQLWKDLFWALINENKKEKK